MNKVTTVGIDLAKRVFALHGIDVAGQVRRGLPGITRNTNMNKARKTGDFTRRLKTRHETKD